MFDHQYIRLYLLSCFPKNTLVLWPLRPTSRASRSDSGLLQKLVFTSRSSNMLSHESHTIHFMRETWWHRKIRSRKNSGRRPGGQASPRGASSNQVSIMPISCLAHPAEKQFVRHINCTLQWC